MRKITITTLCLLLVSSVAIMAAQNLTVTRPLPTSEQPYWGASQSLAPKVELPPPPAIQNTTPNPPTILQGGDNINDATFIPSLPFTDDGTTAGFTDDYQDPCGGTVGGPDVVYSYTPSEDQLINIHLCGTSFYAVLYVYENSVDNLVGCNSFSLICQSGPPSGSLDLFPVTAGNTYYIVVDGYYSSQGPYSIQVTTPPHVTCPSTAIPEGEPDCGDGYYDTFNSGCNDTLSAFSPIAIGDTICGVSGTYVGLDGGRYRDTDWYSVTITDPQVLTWSAVAEFPVQIFMFYATPCSTLQDMNGKSASAGDTVSIAANCIPGTYYFWIAPMNFDPIYACPMTYLAWLNSSPAPPPPPNDNCEDVTPLPLVPGLPLTITGDNTGATMDCVQLGMPDAWTAFTLDMTANVTIDYCGTNPYFGTIFVVLVPDCPCNGWMMFYTYSQYDCGDNNFTVQWHDVPPGTYYYPILSKYGVASGPYTIHIKAEGHPQIDVTPDQLTGEAQQGNSAIDTLAISNVGFADLNYLVIPEPNQTLHQASVSSIRNQLKGSAAFDINVHKPAKLISNNLSGQNQIAGGFHGQRRVLQGGEDINSAVPIYILPYFDTGNTSGAINDYESSLCPNGTGAPDLVYSYTPDHDMHITVSLCGSSFDTKLYVYQNDASNEIACNDDYCGTSSQIGDVPVSAGNTYYIIVDGYSEGSEGDYVLNVSEFIPCIVSCPTGSIPEDEPCGEDMDGGCNATPPVFQDISINNTVCGTSWSDGHNLLRDSDWYQFSVTEPTFITCSGVAEFPIQIILIDGNTGCPPSNDQLLNGAIADPCSTATFSWTINPGTYWIFVSANNWYDQPCGGTGAYGNNYYFTINGTPSWLSLNALRGTIPVGAPPVDVSVTMNAVHLSAGTYTGTVVVLSNDSLNPEIDVPVTFTVDTAPGCQYIPGDINGNHSVNGVDIVFAVNYFKGLPNVPPVDCGGICPEVSPFYAAGDVNGNCAFNGIDITYFVRFLKLQVPSLFNCPDCPPIGTTARDTTPIVAPTIIPANKEQAKASIRQ